MREIDLCRFKLFTPADAAIEYPADEYPELLPHPKEQVVALIEDTQETRVLTFAA